MAHCDEKSCEIDLELSESETKKLKLAADHDHCISTETETLANFKMNRILRDDQKTKFICVEGNIKGSDEPALLLMEKEPFPTQSLPRLLSKETTLVKILKNDIYSTFQARPPADLAACQEMPWRSCKFDTGNFYVFSEDTKSEWSDVQNLIGLIFRTFMDDSSTGFKSTLIYPCTQKHIDKYCDFEAYIISETPSLYQSVTLPCLGKSNFSLQWVYNILEKKSEAERIVFEDTDSDSGFVLLPDMKWNGKDVDSLYLVAIAHKHGIKSLRDLQAQHLPLLKNILEKGTAVYECYGVPKSQLRVYLHYQPSYYHLHVHFTHLRNDAPGTDVLRAHLLEEVIDNIETNDTFYEKKNLMFSVKENQELFKAYQQAGYFA